LVAHGWALFDFPLPSGALAAGRLQYLEKANVNAGAKKTLQKAGPFSGSYAPVKASGMIR
jgi:hypothetical protein